LTSRTIGIVGAGAVALFTAAVPPAGAQPRPAPLHLLDVPYVPQSVELCGGAAAAMVLRYWGATGIYAESFEELVDPAAGGIRGEDLLRAIRDRGWAAASFGGDPPLIRRHLDERHPPIVLIEDRPGRFHYVVVVGWTDGRVVLHDPARAPFRILKEQDFVAAWQRSDFWTLVARPASDRPKEPVPTRESIASPPATATACTGMVDQGIRLARNGELDAAFELLDVASGTCPDDAAVWRELAGVHATRKDWRRAAADARRALSRDTSDRHAARILATSLFLEGDSGGALDAWNRTGEPLLDLVDIRGLARTRHAVAARALSLTATRVLTAAELRRGARRLAAVPAVAGARVTYVPAGEGIAQVTAAVLERPLLPVSAAALVRTAVRAVSDREARGEMASLTGGGELWHASWRWWRARPAVSFGLSVPGPVGGVWSVVASDEHETFAAAGRRMEHERRRVAFEASDWATGIVRWHTGIGIDRWTAGDALAFSGGLRVAPDDRLEVEAVVGRWVGAPSTWQGSATAAWRSRSAQEGSVWHVRGGAHAAGATAPLALWQGAGTGQARVELLRAHPLVHDGVIGDGVFGRQLIAGSAEWRRWGRPVARLVRVAPAAFLDVARAWRVGDVGDPRLHADIGVGVRLAFPGSGVLRADLARGLRDGRMAASLGWSY